MNGLRKVIEQTLAEHGQAIEAVDARATLAGLLVDAIEAEFAIGLLARRVDQCEHVVAEFDRKMRAMEDVVRRTAWRLDGDAEDDPEATSIEEIRAWVAATRDGGKR